MVIVVPSCMAVLMQSCITGCITHTLDTLAYTFDLRAIASAGNFQVACDDVIHHHSTMLIVEICQTQVLHLLALWHQAILVM